MKPIVFGAVLGLVWVLLGLPLAVPETALPTLLQPVTVAFTAGRLTRPYLARSRRWAR